MKVSRTVLLIQPGWYSAVVPMAACLLEGQLDAPCCFTQQLHNKSYISEADCISFIIIIIISTVAGAAVYM